MKKLFLISAIILCNAAVFAQNNPYAMMGYVNPTPDYYAILNAEEDTALPNLMYLYNTDTTAEVQVLAFDFANAKVYAFDGKDSLLQELAFEIGDKAISPDPHWFNYPDASPYAYCGNNPIMLTDPDGRDPVYDPDGNFLGTDDKGLKGFYIVMNKENFKQGMSNKEAVDQHRDLNNKEAYDKLNNHYGQLSTRPDYDGHITDADARDWWKNGNGQPLFVDMSQISLKPVTTKDFEKNNKITHNFFFDVTSDTDVGRVYGTLTLTLKNPTTGEVIIGNPNTSYIDTYDFNTGGSLPRNIATWGAKQLVGKGTSFSIFGWGNNPTVKVKK